MSHLSENQVNQYEARLKRAMLASDVRELDELLADDLIFTNHLGQCINKQEDLHGHAAGLLKIDEIRTDEMRVQLHHRIAIVSVRTYLSGRYNGTTSAGFFRFTRIWSMFPAGGLQVIAGHACMVA